MILLCVYFQIVIRGAADLCQCGGKGWRTLYPLLEALARHLIAAAVKMEWTDPLDPSSDPQPSNIVILVVGADADWPAYAKLFCMRLWNHTMWPCPCCNINKLNILSLSNVSASGGPWENYSAIEYWLDVSKSKRVPRIVELLLSRVFCKPRNKDAIPEAL